MWPGGKAIYNLTMRNRLTVLLPTVALFLTLHTTPDTKFGPQNPLYSPSTLPFHAPPFDKIKDEDYQPAIEAGMSQELTEIQSIADNPAPPTFENTLVAMEKSGELLDRASNAFDGVVGANTNPALEKVQADEAPKLAAFRDAIYLNAKLFARVSTIYNQRESLHLDPESLRLLQVTYDEFVRSGANLSDNDKAELKKLNEQIATLSNDFRSKVLEATKNGAYSSSDKNALAGLSDAQIAAAAEAAQGRKLQGYLIPLQNTTQQPDLALLTLRSTREALYERSWNRTERGDTNDTRDIIAHLAQLRARRAQLLGFPNHAAWRLGDQMAKTPEAALKFMDALVPASTGKAASEGADIQTLIDAQKGSFTLQAWDWDFYADQVRKAKYDLNDAEVKPYFELNNVLENGVFYGATQLYGITFRERKDIPVYHPDVRVFEVFDADGKSLALFYGDYFKRDNKNGGAWMSNFVTESTLLGNRPVVYNVANLPKPAPGEPALITFDDVTAMFHEFGHALNGMFANTIYPSLSGANTARDFVEFPSQFNEHWALYPAVFNHYARHYKTGEPMPVELIAKIRKSATFNQGYKLTELLAAAELDMQWHTLPASAPLQEPDAFQQQALEKTHLLINAVPPRYRSTYFSHIWSGGIGGYSAGYYAYLWAEMLDDDAFQWFEDNGGLTRPSGDRFRQMILSRGNTENLQKLYEAWRGQPPSVQPMMKYRGLQ